MTWLTQALGTLVRDGELSYGIVQPGSEDPTGVPIVRVKDLRHGRVDQREPLRVSAEISRRHSRTVLEGGELLVTIVGTVGEAAVAPPSLAGWNVARAIAVVRPVHVSSEWVRLCLETPTVREHFRSMLNTTVQATLNLADLKRLTIPVPPASERRQIEEVIGALDDKIATNAELAATIDDLLGSTFAALTDGSPTAALSTIAEVNAASTKPVPGGSLRYLDIASVGVGSYELPEIISWDDAPGRARRILRQGDTVWSTVRPNRRSHALVLDEDPLLVASTGLAVLTPKRGQFAFVYEATRTERFTAYLEAAAEGSAYPAVRADRFLQAPVPQVHREARERFEYEAAALRRRLHTANLETRVLAEMRDALLPELMTGKIRIRDAERVLEGVV